MNCCEKRLYYNGRIVTLDAEDSRADAVLVAGDRIEAVGGAAELRGLGGPRLRETDLDGLVVYPGFIDTHSHPDLLAAWAPYAYCGGTADLASALDILRRHDQLHDLPIPMGYGFDDTAIAERRGPDLAEMDALFPDKPAVLLHISIHAAYINSRMYDLLGIPLDRPSDNIDIVCENGRPNGLVTEGAALAALDKLPPVTPESLKRGLLAAVDHYNAQGFTACIGGGAGLGGLTPHMLGAALADLEREGSLRLHLHLPVYADRFEQALESGLLDGAGSPLLRFHGIKLLTDGSIQAYTAAVPEGYHSRPEIRPATIIPQDELEALVFKAHSAGQQAVIHGNGNGAIEAAIQAVEKAQARFPRADPRHLLIHCQMASDAQLARMKAAGLWPSFFGLHVWNWGDRHHDVFLGPERAARIDPCGSAVRLGLPFSLHADTPVLPQMTMLSIHTAVNRETKGGAVLGPDQRISTLEAVRAYTSYAALFSHSEAWRGTIEPGKVADFVIPSEDILEAPAGRLKGIAFAAAIVDNRVVHGQLP